MGRMLFSELINYFMNMTYIAFNNFIFRSPLIEFEKFIKALSEISISEEIFKNQLQDKMIQEAIYIASPGLFEEILRYLDRGLSNKEVERLKYSITRYLSRMSTRCTPFGVFAGCALGQLGEHTNITMTGMQAYQRHTRLDMNYLCALSQYISKMPEIKHHIKYLANTSIYKLGDKFRYTEYFYKETRRIHRITAVDYSEYLNRILQKVSKGATHKELANILVDDEITLDEASDFIDELIDAQFLVSRLDPSVTGEDFLYQMLQELEEIRINAGANEQIDNLVSMLRRIIKLLSSIDNQPIGNSIEIYNQIISELKVLTTKFEQKYLFQTDLLKPVEVAILSSKIIDDIIVAIEFLNKLTPPAAENALSKFRKTFYERYEEREVPLLEALDNESGIGYQQTGGDINPLVDDLTFPRQQGVSNNIAWNMLQSVLLKKYMEALVEKKYTIELTDDDFKSMKAHWEDLPPTISVLCEILQDDENGRKIFLKSVGGSSAANLLGRFCHLSYQIKNHVRMITNKEEELNPDIIYAEIAHLPESRTGNILFRPVLRLYEIPYLAKSSVEKEYQIELSDLMVSVKKDRILLRSKRLNKEIIPRLSNAHNYNYNAMPVYQFLCDMQIQNKRVGLSFFWGSIFNEYTWLPKVKYKNIVLSRARWMVKIEDVKSFFEIADDKILIGSVTEWRKSLQIPNQVLLYDGDNELFTDMENPLSVRTLFSIIKKRPSFYLEEFLFRSKQAIIKNDEGTFTNEFVFSFYNEKSEKYRPKTLYLAEKDKTIEQI
jgi:lantibiotic biosynthesis protein